jgi:hypothetical protein
MARSVISKGFVAGLVFGIQFATAAPITEYFHALDGTSDPINIVIDGVTLNTGPIQFTLDTTIPTDSFFVVDLNSLTIESHVDLLVTSPLLTALGQPPQRLHVDETGDITSIQPPGTSIADIIEVDFDGSGVFAPNQFFAGWIFSNRKHVNHDDRTIDPVRFRWGPDSGALRSPDGTQNIPLILRGVAEAGPVPVPEPRLVSLIVGVLGMLYRGMLHSDIRRKSQEARFPAGG